MPVGLKFLDPLSRHGDIFLQNVIDFSVMRCEMFFSKMQSYGKHWPITENKMGQHSKYFNSNSPYS